MRRKSLNIGALLLGTAVGVLGGILFAPTKGIDVRQSLSFKIKHSIEKLQDLIKTLSQTQDTTSNLAKSAGQDVIDETIDKAKQLLADANELAAQLEP